MAQPVVEQVCVSARSSTAPIEAAATARSDPAVALARRALVRGEVLPPVPPEAFVRYVPPEPTTERFEVRAAAAVDPADPSRGWVAVEALTPLGKSEVPLHLTVLLDLSESMVSAPLAAFSALQDDVARPVQRDELARAVLGELVERLPSRAEWSLVAFARDRASTVLLPTPGHEREAIGRALGRASPELARSGSRSPLDQGYAVAGTSLDGCADNRILLVTDDHARLDLDPDVVAAEVARWAERGIELWTLSLGTLGLPSPKLEALTRDGRGVMVYADTLGEAVEPVAAALRATGTAVRDPAVSVAFGPGVTGWRASDGRTGTGPDAWVLPGGLEAGWRRVALYEVDLAPGGEPAATVSVRGASPVPGDWTVARAVPAGVTGIEEAPALLRHRVFAWTVGQGWQDPGTDWAAVAALGDRWVREDGAARELRAWVGLRMQR